MGTLGCRRIYIAVSDESASYSDGLIKLQLALRDHPAGIWMGIPAHTPYDALIPILRDIREKAADCIVTLGGGSLADGTKLLTYAFGEHVEMCRIRPTRSF